MKRFCICVFWEKDGIIRDYVEHYIKGLKEVCDKILVVVNGNLTENSELKLSSLGVDVLKRENKGLDFGAWKEAILSLGFEKLSDYDELILTNTTCYGPIYSLSEMFLEMENRDCDFWGITKHPYKNIKMLPKIKNSQILEHIQSYFLVFNKNVIQSKTFKDWWNNIKFFNDYKKIVYYYETKLTQYFENFGFKSDSFINLKNHEKYVDNPMLFLDKLIKKYRIPLIKRKAIIQDYNIMIANMLTYQAGKILKYLKENTDYNIDMIYDDIIHTQKMSDIKKNLHLNYILPSEFEINKDIKKTKNALILHVYYEDLVENCLNYASSMPDGTDIYIVSPKESTLNVCKQKSDILKGKNIFYRLKENRGRAISAYLVTCKDVFKNYDLICCIHDKKVPQFKEIIGNDFSYQCFECNLKSKEYVKNIINIFNNNKFIGLLSQPTILFHIYSYSLGNELGQNYNIVKKLYNELNITIPFDKNPIVPFGSMFWVRGKAIQPLFKKDWKYEDFPEEPIPEENTIYQAIEKIYPSIVQEAGYLTGNIMPEDFASLHLDILYNKISDIILNGNPLTKKYKPIEKIFSIKNGPYKQYKIITILGKQIKLNNKK